MMRSIAVFLFFLWPLWVSAEDSLFPDGSATSFFEKEHVAPVLEEKESSPKEPGEGSERGEEFDREEAMRQVEELRRESSRDRGRRDYRENEWESEW